MRFASVKDILRDGAIVTPYRLEISLSLEGHGVPLHERHKARHYTHTADLWGPKEDIERLMKIKNERNAALGEPD